MFKEKRLEEREAHEVIPMPMGQYKIVLITSFLDQVIPQAADAGAGIHDDNVIALCPNLEAGSVAAVFDILPARNWNGASRSPAANYHSASSILHLIALQRYFL